MAIFNVYDIYDGDGVLVQHYSNNFAQSFCPSAPSPYTYSCSSDPSLITDVRVFNADGSATYPDGSYDDADGIFHPAPNSNSQTVQTITDAIDMTSTVDAMIFVSSLILLA